MGSFLRFMLRIIAQGLLRQWGCGIGRRGPCFAVVRSHGAGWRLFDDLKLEGGNAESVRHASV